MSDLSEISSVASLVDTNESPLGVARRAGMQKLHTVQKMETFGKVQAPEFSSSKLVPR